jgi:hypothetical protein
MFRWARLANLIVSNAGTHHQNVTNETSTNKRMKEGGIQ